MYQQTIQVWLCRTIILFLEFNVASPLAAISNFLFAKSWTCLSRTSQFVRSYKKSQSAADPVVELGIQIEDMILRQNKWMLRKMANLNITLSSITNDITVILSVETAFSCITNDSVDSLFLWEQNFHSILTNTDFREMLVWNCNQSIFILILGQQYRNNRRNWF